MSAAEKVLAVHGDTLSESLAAAKGESAAEFVAPAGAEACAAVPVETFGAKSAEDFRSPILGMDQGDLTKCFAGALRRDYAHRRKAKWEIADAANSNVRAAENWLDGKNVPDLLHGLRLAATVPAWRAELRRLLALDAEPDSEIERELTEFVTRIQRKLGGQA